LSTQTVRLVLPKPHEAQRQLIREARRFNVAALGRRTGKTTLAINLEVEGALPGYPVAYFSPTYKMLGEVWRGMRQVLHPILTGVNAQDRRFELLGGGVIDFWSLDQPNSARGRKYKRVIIDEAAMIRDLEEAWQAVIRPTLTDFEGDAWFFSTPKGRNFFWNVFQRGQDREQHDWVSWQMPTTANPFINPTEVEAARRELPERTFAQEYLAQFLEDGGGVFRGVRACATLPGFLEPDPKAKPRATVMGVDWGKSEDFTVLTVLDMDTKEVVGWDRFQQIDWHVQRARLRALADKWKCRVILAEKNSIGDPNIEALQREGLTVVGFTTTNATKAAAIEALVLAIETKAISYPQIPELLNELEAYEMDRLPSGLPRYGAPPGQHDDCVMSLALAVQAITTAALPFGWMR
jgi:hypothetical protein